jgi:hypothetical protein
MPAVTGTRYRMPRYCWPLRLYFSAIARRTGAIPLSEITAGRVTARGYDDPRAGQGFSLGHAEQPGFAAKVP